MKKAIKLTNEEIILALFNHASDNGLIEPGKYRIEINFDDDGATLTYEPRTLVPVITPPANTPPN